MSPTCHRPLLRAAVLSALATLLVAGCAADARSPDAASVAPEPPVRQASSPSVVVDDVFNVLSPWNTPIGDRPVQPDSAALLTRSRGADDGSIVVGSAQPVPVVAGGVPTTLTCRQAQCGDGAGDLVLDVPADVDPDPLDDGRFTVLDPDARVGYDFWRARREADGTISYHFLREWDLDGPGFNQPYVDGVRGSGLPLFAGLVRPDELERGRIDHAVAIGLPVTAGGYFVQPASATDQTGRSDAAAVPEGARLRLRDDVELTAPVDPETGAPLPLDADQRRHADHLVRALQQYGAIVVGRAAVPTLYVQAGAPDGPAPLAGYALQGLSLADFEVLDHGDLTRFPARRSAP